jgi:hypothetical protein
MSRLFLSRNHHTEGGYGAPGVFCCSISEQVAARPYFYRSAKLVIKGLVRPCKTYNAIDLTDQVSQNG